MVCDDTRIVCLRVKPSSTKPSFFYQLKKCTVGLYECGLFKSAVYYMSVAHNHAVRFSV